MEIQRMREEKNEIQTDFGLVEKKMYLEQKKRVKND